MNTYHVTLTTHNQTYNLTLKAASFSSAISQLKRAINATARDYQVCTIKRQRSNES